MERRRHAHGKATTLPHDASWTGSPDAAPAWDETRRLDTLRLIRSIEVQSAVGLTQSDTVRLLNELSLSMIALMEHNAQLETELAAIKDKGRADVGATQEIIRQWAWIVETIKQRSDRLSDVLHATQLRAKAAESEAASTDTRSSDCNRRAEEVLTLVHAFNDMVSSSFGVDSPLHPVLQSLRPPATRI